MGLAIWGALVGIISWSIRILFWPLGLVIKYREFLGTVLPYLVVGLVALIIGSMALRLIGSVVRGGLVVARGMFHFFGAMVGVLRRPPTERSQQAQEVNAEPTADLNDPYQILGVRRDVTENELNLRYRQLLRMNHPDKVAQLDPAIQAFATERARRIIEAFEHVRSRVAV